MYLKIRDFGCKIGDNNQLSSIGRTSILIEWMYEGHTNPIYRMMLDCGLASTQDGKIDESNLSKIRDVMNDKIPPYNNGIQALALSHCHEDHAGGYPWLYQYCKNAGIKRPKLYATAMTKAQFVPFQYDLYDIFHRFAEGTQFWWDKGIINEIRNDIIERDFDSEIDLIDQQPIDFDIKLKFIRSGHIVGSAMIEVDTIKNGVSLGKILYTGDTCFRDGGWLVDPIDQDHITGSYRACIMEATYLLKTYPGYEKLTTTELGKELIKKIKDVIQTGGNIIFLVYAQDRTANILVALRQILDEKSYDIGADLKGKIYLDTKIGSKITNIYDDDLESFVRFENPVTKYSYFRQGLVDRLKNTGRGMLQFNDGRDVYELVRGMERRLDVISKNRNGGCLFVATSATLEGGTALLPGSYMHPDGFGSDDKNLFLIVGGAIPGTQARRVLDQYENKGYATVNYVNYQDLEDGGRIWYTEKLDFTSRIEDLSGFSAHANAQELVKFTRRVNSQKFLVTHIGGHKSPFETQRVVENALSGSPVYVLNQDNSYIVPLKPYNKTIDMDEKTYGDFYQFCIKTKGYYSDIIASDWIRRWISEEYKRMANDKQSSTIQ